jgi:outer membrane lipoprotein-sorting protein
MNEPRDTEPRGAELRDNETRDRETRDREVGAILEGIEFVEHEDGYWDRVREAVEPELAPLRRRPIWRTRSFRVVIGATAAAAAVAIALVGLPGSEQAGHPVGPQSATAAERMLAAMEYGLAEATTMRGNVEQRMTITPPGDDPLSAVWRGTFAAKADGSYRLEMTLAERSEGVGLEVPSYFSPVPKADVPNAKVTLQQQAHVLAMLDAGTWTTRWATWDATGDLTGSGSETAWPVWNNRFTGNPTGGMWLTTMTQAALVRAAVAGDADLLVRDVSYDGREAWEATIGLADLRFYLTQHPLPFRPAVEREVVTVDKETGFILRTEYSFSSGVSVARQKRRRDYPFTVELRITDLKLDESLADSTFTELPDDVTYTPPTDAPPRLKLDEVAAAAGFAPLVPEPLPQGFTFDTASLFNEMDMQNIGTPLFSLRDSRYQEVDQLYRRGFDWFELDMFPWDGELSANEHDITVKEIMYWLPRLPGHRKTVLTGGVLAGATAQSWMAIYDTPLYENYIPIWVDQGLFVFGKGYVVMIRGSISVREMLEIANSLQVYEP